MSRPRVACVDVRALPLQLLSRSRPEWKDAPLAVVEEDHPQARILWVDAKAAQRRVRVGQRYSAALQLARHLRAAPVPCSAIDGALDELHEALVDFSPRVERDPGRAGVFWVDPSGLGSLFGPLERWAERVRAAVGARGLGASVAIGFARLPTWVIARIQRGVFVVESPAEEARLAARAPLLALDAPPGCHVDSERAWVELREGMVALGVRSLGELLALPRGDVGVRFGPVARELHAQFADAVRPPMRPEIPQEPLVIDADLEPPDDDVARLLFCIKGALHGLMSELAHRALALRALEIRLELEAGAAHEEAVEPASATRDALAVLELVRLRLSGVVLPARVERVRLTALPARLDGTQLALFGGRRRDPDAARRSIARLRAAFGDDAVTRAELRDAWLPEDSFRFEPTDTVHAPRTSRSNEGVLVRRLLAAPVALPRGEGGRPRTTPPLRALAGPYRMESGWWSRSVARDYFYGEREDGAVLFLFRDRRQRRWFLHGTVD